MIAANSPGLNPSAFSPAAALRTSCRYSAHVRVSHLPDASLHLWAGESGNSRHVSSKLVRTVLPRAASSIAARSALMSRIKSREYTTRWWWGEPDLRSVAPLDRCHRHRGAVLDGGVRASCGRRVQAARGRGRRGGAGPGGDRRRGARRPDRRPARPLAAGAAVPVPRPPPGHRGQARDARGVDRHGGRHAFRTELLAPRPPHRPPDHPAQERGAARPQAGCFRPGPGRLPRPYRPPARRAAAPRQVARVRFGPRPGDLACRGRGADRTPPLNPDRAIMIAPVISLRGRDFIDVADLEPGDLRRLLDLAREIKAGRWKERPLEGKHMAMLFQRPSHRTRVSFEVGIARLGGATTTLTSQDVQLGFRESVADAARVLDRYVDGVIARLRSHADLLQLARSSEKPVINALTDHSHPCQVLADLLTLEELHGDVAKERVVYIGDGNNIANSLVEASVLAGFALTVITPPGYDPDAAIVERARSINSGRHHVTLTNQVDVHDAT